jgi:hypothetical protein
LRIDQYYRALSKTPLDIRPRVPCLPKGRGFWRCPHRHFCPAPFLKPDLPQQKSEFEPENGLEFPKHLAGFRIRVGTGLEQRDFIGYDVTRSNGAGRTLWRPAKVRNTRACLRRWSTASEHLGRWSSMPRSPTLAAVRFETRPGLHVAHFPMMGRGLPYPTLDRILNSAALTPPAP